MHRFLGFVRRLFTFSVLMTLKIVIQPFYRFDLKWIGEPEDPWGPYKALAILNHTSLFEWLYIGLVPAKFVWHIAGHAMVPVADVTFDRPIVGTFFKLLVPHALPISRQADRTWKAVIDRVQDDVMIVILPEGRMKRADGLDKDGRPMTVRGGIADILHAIQEGKMLLAFSGGLHHVQVPGQHMPKLFKTLKMRLEEIDIPRYKVELGDGRGAQEFKHQVKEDLERRRDEHCQPAV